MSAATARRRTERTTEYRNEIAGGSLTQRIGHRADALPFVRRSGALTSGAGASTPPYVTSRFADTDANIIRW